MTDEITLVSKDSGKVKVNRRVIMMSGLIKDMLEEQDEKEVTIPVPNVDLHTLKKVIEYCELHWNKPAVEIEQPLKGHIEDVISEDDKKFLVMENSDLLLVMMASNYLIIKDLLALTAAKIASMIKGKSTEAIREMFGIENDFTKEEEAELRKENEWCLES